jgi:RNA recognition motif-containing protein
MKSWKLTIGMTAALAFLAAGAALGQSASESTTKEKGSQGSSTTHTKMVSGTVKEYEAGKRIKLTGPDNKTYSFTLDENAQVEGNIVAGQTATVKYTKKSGGKAHVTVLSEGKTGAISSPSSSNEAMAGRAERGESTAAIDSTSKNSGPGNAKTKTRTVIGTVKSYEAGKSITVTGPKDKDYSFDLSENVATKGTVAVGSRVRVSYSKTDNGEKVTTIQSYPTASHPKTTKKTAA